MSDLIKKPKLAIISTYDELCGIASYTKALVPLLENHFEVTVFDLDQFIFKNEAKSVQKLADKKISQIANDLKDFDCVNVQLEHGTFGNSANVIYRRIRKIIRSNKSICITFHTIIVSDSFNLSSLMLEIAKNGLRKAANVYKSNKRAGILGDGIYKLLKKEQFNRSISVIVHTKRDARVFQLVHGIKNVFDHPLAYYSPTEVIRIQENIQLSKFPQLQNLAVGSILLGCFGFVSSYKGIDTAIRAMKLLPSHFHLAIFGGIHPASIKKNQLIDPFIKNLLDEIAPGKKLFDFNLTNSNLKVKVSGDDLLKLSSEKHPEDISDRVHFLGAISDSDFPIAMGICDTVLLPYVEIGQSSSGPMSMAIDMRKHVIAARTKPFMQYLRYHKNRFNMFDVGNHLHLSQLIKAESKIGAELQPCPEFNALTNLATYISALTPKK
jgi:glycosyltransferase involved in cell wall biosynthesis